MSIYRTYVDRSILVAALALVFCAPALPADITWDWGYSSNQFTGSGTLTTESTLTTGLGGFTGYRIVGISGIMDLSLIQGCCLQPVTIATIICSALLTIYGFSVQLAHDRNWAPTLSFLALTAGLIAADPHIAPTFRNTTAFHASTKCSAVQIRTS